MSREDLVEIYENTKEVCSRLETPKSELLNEKTYFNTANKNLKGKIIIEPIDTISALEKYVKHGKTAVINMASAVKKGGGVAKGATAQEESLFRCCNIYTIPDDFYPLDIDEFVYTHDATFIKSSSYHGIYVKADVITIAAPNVNKENKYYNENDFSKYGYEEQLYMKIIQMLSSAAHNGCKNIILGAWGCGVYKNDPKKISETFRDILKTERFLFDNVVFAVINDKNSVANNYQIFKETFN